MKLKELEYAIVTLIKDSTPASGLREECDSLGMPRCNDDPCSSDHGEKRRYVNQRIALLSRHDFLDLAEKTAEETSDSEKTKYLDSIFELRHQDLPPIPEDLRRKILEAYALETISGRMASASLMAEFEAPDLSYVLDTDWPWGDSANITRRSSYQDHDEHSIDTMELAEKVGIFGWSRRKFLRLIEATLHPRCRDAQDAATIKELIAPLLMQVGWTIVNCGTDDEQSYRIVPTGRGVNGVAKNLIFGSVGRKPEFIFHDVLNYDIEIVSGAENCLIYDKPLPPGGLLWRHLVSWWAAREGIVNNENARQMLGERLKASCYGPHHGSRAELSLFRCYFHGFSTRLGPQLPALIPQVWLHYDPATLRQLGGKKRLERQRMDFLLLLPNNVRVVIEVDGKQHFATADGRASLLHYSRMVAADRDLRLVGYEIYRFGASELWREGCEIECVELITKFFDRLFKRHNIL